MTFENILQALYLFILAFVFSAIEVENEGKYGWAQKMPTWYRTQGIVAKLYGVVMGGKPLTGYHSFMFFMPILVFHVPFFMGKAWTVENELLCWLYYFTFAPLWDYLWFIINPNYGFQQFRKENVWWHSKSYWFFNRIPHDHVVGWSLTIVIAVIMGYIGENQWQPLTDQLWRLTFLFSLTIYTILLSPLYHKWYWKMRERDDRDKVKFPEE